MLSTGEIVDGKYRIIRLIGEGGMGAVYEGENTRIHRRVAIKVLHAGVAETAEAVQRFEREAQAAGRIGSEHIVEVLDLGNLASGDRYMVMEFMDGDSLSARIQKSGRIAPIDLYPIAHQLLAALHAAHTAGIIHRDLKPDNVYLLKTRSGVADFVKLLDFGISKFNQLSGDSGFSMTRTGAVMGTPYYMAPEQASGESAVDHRADIWSLGVILYECLSGTRPIEGENLTQVVSRLMSAGIIPLERIAPELPHDVSAIVTQMLSRDAQRRPETLREVSTVLARYARAISVPDFAEPSTDRGSLLPHPPQASLKPKPRFISSTSADPRGPTMLSAPPVNSSVHLERPSRVPQPKNRTLTYGVLGAICMLAIWLIVRRGSTDPPRSGEAAALPASAPALPSAATAPSASAVSAVANPSSTTTSPPSATNAPKQHSAGASGATRAGTRPKNDDLLFPGRK